MRKRKSIEVEGSEIRILSDNAEDFISLTDITKNFPDGKFLVPRWLRNRDTLSFIGTWEKMHNRDFRVIEFDNLYQESGLNQFSLSVSRWIEKTGAIGFKVKRGRGATTFAHKDIAMGFCYWLSPPFQLYLIKEFQQLKEAEALTKNYELEWNVKRMLSKINHKVHTDAIKENLIPPRITKKSSAGFIYANETDMLNVALFGVTAKEWRTFNPKAKGNVRDHATTEQLLVLANLEAINAELIRAGISQDERVARLNEAAISQMHSLLSSSSFLKLPDSNKNI